MLGGGVGRIAVDEHLDLVEPVHSEDAAGVFAVGAGLAAVAGAVADVVTRQGRGVQDLLGMIGGQRHLRGTDQVQVVIG